MNREDVINKIFPHSLFGYDPVAVDAFLDEVIREFDRLNNTIDVLKLKISQELGEAQEINRMLTSNMQREGFLKRADELVPVTEPGSAPDEALNGSENALTEEEDRLEEPTAEKTEDSVSEEVSEEATEVTPPEETSEKTGEDASCEDTPEEAAEE